MTPEMRAEVRREIARTIGEIVAASKARAAKMPSPNMSVWLYGVVTAVEAIANELATAPAAGEAGGATSTEVREKSMDAGHAAEVRRAPPADFSVAIENAVRLMRLVHEVQLSHRHIKSIIATVWRSPLPWTGGMETAAKDHLTDSYREQFFATLEAMARELEK